MSAVIERGLVRTSFGQIHYRTAGAGQPIVLLHINQQSSASYLELIEELAPNFQAVAIDYPSHGMSDHIFEQPTIADYARCVIEVIDALSFKQVVVLGEATGAGVSVELAANHPDRIAKVVLVNCPYSPNPEPSKALLAPFLVNRPADETGFPLTRTIEFFLKMEARQCPMRPTQDWMDRINTAQIQVGRERWQALTALSRYDLAGAMKRVSRPVLLLTGEFFYFAAHAEAAATLLKAEGHVLKDARFNAGWECATEIASHIRRFLG